VFTLELSMVRQLIKIGEVKIVPRVFGGNPMSKTPPTMFPDPDTEAEAIEALEKAQKLPPGKERTEALKKAGRLRNAADTYRHIFSNELKPPS